MTKVTNIFVSYNIVTDKVVSNNMKTIVHDRKNSVLFIGGNLCKFEVQLQNYTNILSRQIFRTCFHGNAGEFSCRFPPRRGSARYPAGMCAIFGKDGAHPGQRWRTSPADIEKAFFRRL